MQVFHEGKAEIGCCFDSKKLTPQVILSERTGGHIACRERPRACTWGCVQQKMACCFSWKISFASQRSQLIKDLWFQVAVS